MVLAKYVPDLEIVSILMSDEPVMGPARSYYQRLVARDESEAATLVQDYVASHRGSWTSTTRCLVPALNHAQRDHERDRITEADLRFVERTTRELIEELDPSEPIGRAGAPSSRRRSRAARAARKRTRSPCRC